MSKPSVTRGTLSMRRSSSLSHIPRPSTLVRDQPKLRRPRSITRTDGRKTSLEQNLKRSSSSSNLLRTPLQSRSSLRTPQQGASGTHRYSSNARSPFSVKKDRPTNDKKWVAEQFVKVKRYLEDHPSCDPNILKNLKPPTLNTFVYVCNLLLKDLDPRNDISLANYKESVAAHLKILNYPGSFSNSLLKTVNTMHSWPHVISILSWLVDLLTYIARNTLDPEILDKRGQLKNTFQNHFFERYSLFNKSEDQTPADENFVYEMNAVLGNNEKDFNEFSKEVEHFRGIQELKHSQLVELEQNNKALSEEIEEKRQELNKFYSEDPENQKQLESEVKRQQERKRSIQNKIVKVTKNISNLKETISKQPCTYAEKKSILENIDEMKYTVELKKEKLQEWLKIKSDFDYKLVDLKRKLESEVYRINKNIMQISVINPDFKSLNLRDRGFLNKDFKDEVTDFVETKMKLEDKLDKDIACAKLSIDVLKRKKKELSRTIETLRQQIEACTIIMEELEGKITMVDNKTKDVIAVSEELVKEYILATADLKNQEPDLQELELSVKQRSEEYATTQTEFTKLQTDSLKFLLNLQHIVADNLKKIDQIRVSISQQVNSAERSAAEVYQDLLHHYQKLETIIDDDLFIS